MYATVIASQTAEGATRQTAVVARASGDVIVFSRIAGGRGRAGAWTEGTPDIITDGSDEQVLGMPSTVKVTDTDEAALELPKPKPTVLWQKLARVAASEDFLTTQWLLDTFQGILDDAKEDPRRLAQYLGGSSDAPASVLKKIKVEQAPVAPVQAVIEQPTSFDIDAWITGFQAQYNREPDAREIAQAIMAGVGGAQPVTPVAEPTVEEEDEPNDDDLLNEMELGLLDEDEMDEDDTPAVLAASPTEEMAAAIQKQQDAEQEFVAAFAKQVDEQDPTYRERLAEWAALDGDDEDDLQPADTWESLLEKASDEPMNVTVLNGMTPEQIKALGEQIKVGNPEVAEHVQETYADQVEHYATATEAAVQIADAEEPALMTPAHIGAGGHVPQKSELAPLIIPSLSDVEGYVERTLPGDKTETEVYDYARKTQSAVAVFGHSGTGKTSSARNYAAQRGLPFVAFECNPQTDEEVVQGTYIPTGNGTELAWRYSQLATAIQRPSVILLNESNRMSAKANALFLHLLQERELIISRHKNEVIPVHPEVLFITDANPGYAGTTRHDQAFLDRFAITLEFKYDREVEKHFIPSKELLDMAEELRQQAEREDAYRDTPVSTRLLVNFVNQARGLGMEFAIASFVQAFSADERDALRTVVDVHASNIASELGIADDEYADVEESADEDVLTF